MPKKLSIEEARHLAEQHNGLCLSAEYVNAEKTLHWKCKNNHDWYAPLRNIKYKGLWCPYCPGNQIWKPLELAQGLAAERGGKCLASECRNTITKILWQCEKNHKWHSDIFNIKGGHWCPYCAGCKYENGLEEATKLAEQYNGKCLSKNYSYSSKLEWRCERGHIFYKSISKVKHGNQWCPECKKGEIKEKRLIAGNRQAKEIAGRHNALCLSQYVDSGIKMLWQCECGFRWSSTLKQAKKHWCSRCACKKLHKKQKLENALQIAQGLAAQHNGYCLSSEYINAKTKLLWECEKRHQWKTILHCVRGGCWCPECGHLEGIKNSNSSYTKYNWKNNEELICQGTWEAKVVDYLNDNQIEYVWQPKVFVTPIKTARGSKTTYRPDCYLLDEDKWIEVKGYFWEDAKEKWDWFHMAHPNSELWNKNKLREMNIL